MKTQALRDCKILICVGSGGVGKTTMAAALGVLAAQSGLATLVLTIDPSQRLAQILGFEGHTQVITVPNQNYPGLLYASIVDHRSVFDEFVRKAAQSTESAGRIQKNRLYQQLSTTLSGSQEFTALESLYQAHESGKYDLIILDTPPAQHAIDFLEAPQKLAALFNEDIAKWFRSHGTGAPGIFRAVMNSGARQVLKILEGLTGSEFMHELTDFFSTIEVWQSKLHDRIVQFHRLLVDPGTHFALVTNFEEAKLKEALTFSREIQKSGLSLKHVFLNRACPEWSLHELVLSGPDENINAEVKRLFFVWKTFYALREKLFESFSGQLPREILIYRLAELIMPISNLQGLEKMSLRIQESSSR